MMTRRGMVPPELAEEIEQYATERRLDDEGLVYGLYLLASNAYARGFTDGTRVEAARRDGTAARKRLIDAERTAP